MSKKDEESQVKGNSCSLKSQHNNSQAYHQVPQHEEDKGQHLAQQRTSFVRKIFSVLTAQLLIAVSVCLYVLEFDGFRNFLRNGTFTPLLYTSVGIFLVVAFTLICYQQVALTAPINIILLLIFTLSQSYIVAYISANTNPSVTLMATLFTLVMIFSLTLYALVVSKDIQMLTGVIVVFITVAIVAGLYLGFSSNSVSSVVKSFLGVIVFAIYIIYDTEIMLNEKGFSNTIDDFAIGALHIYVDIIELFIGILSYLGIINED